jgi:hypothetical protein
VSLVLLAILVVIWASILVPLLRRDRGNWPGGRRPVAAPSGNASAGRGGRAVWRPEPESFEEAEVSVPDLTVVPPPSGGAGRPVPAAARGGRRAPDKRRAVFRRRRVLAALVLAALVTAVPALLLGGGWLALEAAPGLPLAAYLIALVLLARRRNGAAPRAAAHVAATPRSLAAVPAAPE